MPQSKTAHYGITKDVLKKELFKVEKRLNGKIDDLDSKIDGVEKRLDAKIDSTAQSFKEYVDSRWKQLDTKFSAQFEKVDQRFEKIDQRFEKMEKYFEQLVGMVVQQNKKLDTALEILQNHERRLIRIEERVL